MKYSRSIANVPTTTSAREPLWLSRLAASFTQATCVCARVGLSIATILSVAEFSPPAAGQSTNRVSVDSGGAQGNGQSLSPSMSADGRHITFVSLSTNLVSGDTNGFLDTFARDLQSGVIERVSVASNGAQGNNHSGGYRPSISADGRYVAFGSAATNLVAGDTNSRSDVFVRDRISGTTTRVSVSSSGIEGDGESGTYGISLSADGRYVAFVSRSSNLVIGDTNGFDDVFVRDRTSGTTTRASVASGGAQGNHLSGGYNISISADGRFVAFGGYASNLAPGGTAGIYDVYVRDLQNSTTERVSADSFGVGGDGDSGFNGLALSATGRFVVFESLASNLAPATGPGNILLRDRTSGTTELVSVDSGGAMAAGSSYESAISADGRYVAFVSGAANVVSGDTNASTDVFIRDRWDGTNERVSVSSTGTQGNNDSGQNGVAVSADGRHVAFASAASNLAAGDTNGVYDIFARDRGLLDPRTFCTAGTTTNGCLSSISGTGTPSASSGSGFTLGVNNVEGQKQGLFFYCIDNSGFTPIAWGTGTSILCVKSPVQRTSAQNSGGIASTCTGALVLDWNTYIAAHPGALGQPFSIGQHVFVQAWFRDPPAPKTTSLSNALEFVVGP